MPLPITRGLGSNGPGTVTELLSTIGYGGYLSGVVGIYQIHARDARHLDVIFTVPVNEADASSVENYTITSNNASLGTAAVNHWRANESDGMILYDRVGTIPGVFQGSPEATFVQGQYGAGIQVTGGDGCAEFSGTQAVNRSTGFTISAWVKTVSGANGTAPFFGMMGAGLSNGWALSTSTGGKLAFLGFGTNTVSGSSYANGLWHHVAASWTPSIQKLYVDGALVASTASAAYIIPTVNLKLGTAVPGSPFSGVLDDAWIFNRALTLTEINLIRSAPDSVVFDPPLVVHEALRITDQHYLLTVDRQEQEFPYDIEIGNIRPL